MSLKSTIEADIKKAMLAKDKDRLRALRAIKSAILLAETEKGAGELDEAAEMSLLTKAAKQRQDSLDIYKKEGRSDLAEKEEQELLVIQEYLPKQMSDEELEAAVKQIIDQTGASDMKDMGKVMGVASKSLAGQADNKRISGVVRKLLG